MSGIKIMIVSCCLLLLPFFALAQVGGGVVGQNITTKRGTDLLSEIGVNAGYQADKASALSSVVGADLTVITTITAFVKIFLQIVGVILLIIIIYGGFLWFTAGGNDDQVAKARKYLTNAAIGMVIIGTSYLLAGYIERITLPQATSDQATSYNTIELNQEFYDFA